MSNEHINCITCLISSTLMFFRFPKIGNSYNFYTLNYSLNGLGQAEGTQMKGFLTEDPSSTVLRKTKRYTSQ